MKLLKEDSEIYNIDGSKFEKQNLNVGDTIEVIIPSIVLQYEVLPDGEYKAKFSQIKLEKIIKETITKKVESLSKTPIHIGETGSVGFPIYMRNKQRQEV